jgi:Type I phosphodiesterase / nucleotide pyrophosphatase
MPLRRALLILFACCLTGILVPLGLGLTYTERLATRPAAYLVSVPDRPAPSPEVRRPRRTVLIVFDGLGYEEARGMRAIARLGERGQCRKTDVGSLTLSRPVYGTISTGVEQDRGGALINDSTAPHQAESIWQIARESGLTVAAVSELPWWRELFPGAFTTYLTPPREADYFRLAPPADLLLVHPLYIDETGHASGADSDEYRAAVARADRELLDFSTTLDLDRDLLVVTADHGHALRGGHGGRQDRIAHVLTCYAGPGVAHRAELGAREAGPGFGAARGPIETGTLRVTSLAPSLMLLMGLRFPAGMRAGDDDLDALWEVADATAFPAAYLEERHGAVARFRAENQAQVTRWRPGSGGSWAAFYAASRREQAASALPFAGLLVLLVWIHRRGHRLLSMRAAGGRSGFRFGLVWWVGCGVAAWALQTGLRGSFDMSSIANGSAFIRFTLALGIGVGVGALALHLLLRRSRPALLWDASLLSLVGTTLCLAHPAALGWHVGFPVPAPPLFFFPFFAALFLPAWNGVALLFCAWATLAPAWPLATPSTASRSR